MSNKKDGNRLENQVAGLLYRAGYWVHVLQQASAGQPADLLAIKGDTVLLIDCKNCTGDRFALSRIEYNQEYAMNMFQSRTNGICLFAIYLSDGLYFIDYNRLKGLKQKSVNAEWLTENCTEVLK